MRKLIVVVSVLLLAFGVALAGGENKPFFEPAKGNFWEYEVTSGAEKHSEKLEVLDVAKDGTCKLKATGMLAGAPENMTWKFDKDFLSWDMGPEMKWKVLKLDAKKGDKWTSELPGEGQGEKRTMNSEVVAVEDIETPAGKFKACLKIKNAAEGSEETNYMWWARGVGLVKVEVSRDGKIVTSSVLKACKVGPGKPEKPFILIAKGYTWQYDIQARGRTKAGKIEVVEMGEDGNFKVKLTDVRGPEGTAWQITRDFFIWDWKPGFKWKVLKFGVKKGDEWHTTVERPGRKKLVMKSRVVAVKDIQTPAGKFANCLKVRNAPEGSDEEEIAYMWWARGVGLVKLEVVEGGKMDLSWSLTSFNGMSGEKLKEMLAKAYGAAPEKAADALFLRLAKGNFWQYDTVERADKGAGKMELTEVLKGGKYKLKITGRLMDGDIPAMTWEMDKDSLTWELMPGFRWKVIKFGAKKGDTWTTDPGEAAGEMAIVIKSTVAAVEDIETPAGKFKGCLRVQSAPEGDLDIINMWWARGVGLVKLEITKRGEVREAWTLTSYKVGYDITDDKLKEMVEKSDVVALVAIPNEGVRATKVQVTLNGLYKGEPPKVAENEILITRPKDAEGIKGFDKGDFIVFLKKDGDTLTLLYSPVKADATSTDRLAKLLTPEKTRDKLGVLCDRAQIIVAVEVVVLEDRGAFKYYVVKVLSALKGVPKREHLDILQLPGMNFDKGARRILLLTETQKSGRKMLQPVDVAKGVLDYSEGMLKKLADIIKGSQ